MGESIKTSEILELELSSNALYNDIFIPTNANILDSLEANCMPVDLSTMPDACDIQVLSYVPQRHGKKKRIAKKWIKKYGYKMVTKTAKGWKMEIGFDGVAKFIKDEI